MSPFLSLSIGATILALGIFWAGLILSFAMFLPFASYFGPSPAILSWVGATAALAAAGIPVFLLMMWLTRWFSDYRLPSKFKVPLRIGWIASVLMCGYMIFAITMDHNESVQIKDSENFYISDNTINIKSSNKKELESFSVIRFFHTQYSDKGLVNDNVDVIINKATDDEVTIEKTVAANGSDSMEANERANKIDAAYEVKDNMISLPDYFFVNKSSKLRSQQITYTISIPEGKQVSFGDNVSIRSYEGFEERCRCDVSKYTWTMGKKGLYSDDWLAKYRAKKTISLPKSSNINLEGDYEVIIEKSDDNIAILSGRKNDFEHLKFISTENTASFIKQGNFRGKPKLTIKTNNLKSINAIDIKDLTITGFNQESMEIIYDGYGDVHAYIDVQDLTCDIKGRGTVNLIGSGNQLTAKLTNSKINAEKYKSENINITGQSRGKSKVYASKKIVYDETLNYELEIFGNPTEEKVIGNIQ